MGILGIENRTENWKTAQLLRGLSEVNLARRLGEPDATLADDIRIELFWYGVRDAVHAAAAQCSLDACKPDLERAAAKIYHSQFADLRQQIRDFEQQPFLRLKRHNYVVSQETQKDFLNNLRNTEIDIVLETPERLFIGEAKHESGFGGDGKLILVHQLIRQFVTATILLDLLGEKKEVVPFVVVDDGNLRSVKNTAQVNFMVDQGWLKAENVLSWREIDDIKEKAL